MAVGRSHADGVGVAVTTRIAASRRIQATGRRGIGASDSAMRGSGGEGRDGERLGRVRAEKLRAVIPGHQRGDWHVHGSARRVVLRNDLGLGDGENRITSRRGAGVRVGTLARLIAIIINGFEREGGRVAGAALVIQRNARLDGLAHGQRNKSQTVHVTQDAIARQRRDAVRNHLGIGLASLHLVVTVQLGIASATRQFQLDQRRANRHGARSHIHGNGRQIGIGSGVFHPHRVVFDLAVRGKTQGSRIRAVVIDLRQGIIDGSGNADTNIAAAFGKVGHAVQRVPCQIDSATAGIGCRSGLRPLACREFIIVIPIHPGVDICSIIGVIGVFHRQGECRISSRNIWQNTAIDTHAIFFQNCG